MYNIIEVIAAIVTLIVLICFFFITAALSNISGYLKNINRLMKIWMEVNGHGAIYTCSTCEKHYSGKLSKCPHCGIEIDYKIK